jgi:TetR/AcrR family transcriptional regulator, transcriptional repressor for nem operon
VVRTKGYSATRIEDVRAEAGVTKGSFFHHFKSKNDITLAAVEAWDANATELFATAPYHDITDPLDRLLTYIDYRKALLTGDLPEFTCFPGFIVQEAYRTHPELSAAAGKGINDGAKALEADICVAMEEYGCTGDWTAESLARHMTAVIQGGFVLAKATGSASAAADSLSHLRRYLELLFSGRSATGR